MSLVLASSVASADSLNAQRVTSIVHIGVSARQAGSRASIDSNASRNAPAIRLATAVGGTLLGIVVGATAGYQLFPHDCNCDDPGLDQLVYGGLVGSSFGAALGAAIPRLGSVCSLNQRIGRTLAGATAGGVLAFLVAGGLFQSGSTLIAIPVLSVAGALGSLGRCWKTASKESAG